MAIDTAAKRRSIAGVPFFMRGPGVTPTATPDGTWRQTVCYNYSGIAVGAPIVPPVVVAPPPAIAPWIPFVPIKILYEAGTSIRLVVVLRCDPEVITYGSLSESLQVRMRAGLSVVTMLGSAELASIDRMTVKAICDVIPLWDVLHIWEAEDLWILGLPDN